MKKTLSILSITTSFIVYAQSYDIKLNLEQGKIYTTKGVNNMLINQDVMGQSMEMKNDMKSNLSFKLISTENDKYTLEAKHELLEMNMNAMGREMKMSSEDKTNSEESKMLVAMKNQTFTVIINKAGQVIEIKGYDKILENIIKNAPQKNLEQTKELLKSVSNVESVKSQINQYFLAIPSNKVKIGEQWKKSNKITSTLQMDTEITYTLVSADDKAYHISYTGIVKTNPAEKMKMSGYDATADLKGNVTGTIILDKKTAWINNNSNEMNINGNISLNAGMPVEVVMKMKSNSTVTN